MLEKTFQAKKPVWNISGHGMGQSWLLLTPVRGCLVVDVGRACVMTRLALLAMVQAITGVLAGEGHDQVCILYAEAARGEGNTRERNLQAEGN